MKKIIGFIVIISAVLVACTKEATIPERFTTVPSGSTNIKFLNLALNTPQTNLFANGAKATAAAPNSTGIVQGIAYAGAYPSTVGYASLPAGSIKLEDIIAPSSTVNPGGTLLTTTNTFEAGKYYTVAVVDTFTNAKAVVVEDDPTVPDQTKAYFRVANFIADSSVNIVVTKTSADYAYSKTFTNVAPRTALPFDSLGAGTGQVYKVELRRGSNNALLSTLSSFTPSPSKKYTFYARGSLRVPTGTYAPVMSSYTNF
jgi:hypothetical protein